MAVERPPVVEPVYNVHEPCHLCGDGWRWRLTSRERDVLALVAQGYSNKMVAERFGIKPTSVKNHLTHLMGKLGVHDRTSAVMIAMERGWIRKVEQDQRG